MTNCEIKKTVQKQDLAVFVRSGSLEVLATPVMIAWMEEAACRCVHAEEGITSVGIEMNARHEAASPEGAEILVTARLTEQKGKILTFETEAFMGDVRIGSAVHKRALVNAERFMARLQK
ncbi:MAG: dihydrolipoamide acyltransferase [Erysipelotrichaceae bacterium]|nr:dihydrolipoamide acyltransferase [Erysipelotrichaceae bacterium]